MKKKKLIHKFFPYFLSCSMVLGNILPVAADSNTLINGTVEASKIDISASGTTTYTINGKTLTSDSIGVLNNSNFPISIGVAKVEKTIGTLADVLPDSVGDEEAWFNLGRKDSNSKIALGLKHTSGDYLEEITSGTLYFKQVQDSSKSIGLGAVEAKGSVNYEIDGFHGLSFSSDITEQYKITWDISLYGSSGSTKGDTETYSVDREEDTPLNYELTTTSPQASIKDTLTDLFGVHTVQAAPVDVPKSEVSNVVGEATITGLKDKSITELYIADYYEDENGNFYKITGIKDGTSSNPTIDGSKIGTIVIGDNVEEIGDYAFYSTKVDNLVLPDSLKRIGKYAFDSCNLETINSDKRGVWNFPDNIEEIKDGAFGNGAGQPYNSDGYIVFLPANIKTIGTQAFQCPTGCTKYFLFENTGEMPTIASDAFHLAEGLYVKDDTMRETFISNGDKFGANSSIKTTSNIFENLEVEYTFTETDTEAKLVGMSIPQITDGVSFTMIDKVEIPSTYNGKPVTEIGSYVLGGGNSINAYNDGKKFKAYEITIPSSVKKIDSYAFQYCPAYIINIEEGLEEVEDYAFDRCTNIINLTFPDTVTKMGDYVTDKCTRLYDVTYGSNLTNLPANISVENEYYTYVPLSFTFRADTLTCANSSISFDTNGSTKNRNVTMYVINDTVKSYLEGITARGYVTKTVAVKEMTAHTHHYDTLETTITPATSTTTGEGIYSCSCGEKINKVIPMIVELNLTSDNISTYITDFTTSTTSVNIPASIEKDGKSYVVKSVSLRNNTTITEVSLPEGITSFDFFGCQRLATVNIPSTVKDIPTYAFYNCYALTNVSIAEGVETIGASAFDRSGVKQIALPSTITSIDANAFQSKNSGVLSVLDMTRCINLKSIGKFAFYSVDSAPYYGCKIYVPNEEIKSLFIEGTNVKENVITNCVVISESPIL